MLSALAAPLLLVQVFKRVFFCFADKLIAAMFFCDFKQFEHFIGDKRISANGLEGEIFFQAQVAPTVNGEGITACWHIGDLRSQRSPAGTQRKPG
jgi:hypothetical protein